MSPKHRQFTDLIETVLLGKIIDRWVTIEPLVVHCSCCDFYHTDQHLKFSALSPIF